MALAFSSNYKGISMLWLVVIFSVVWGWGWGWKKSEAFGTFGYDMHHRYSDPVKGILDLHGLPDKGSLDYYSTMVHRDRLVKGRRLASSTTAPTSPLLTFAAGNVTYLISSLGFLHYANVSVGTPGLSFLVALDTGSDLFWLPCDCSTGCVHSLPTRSGREIPLNIYSPNASSTSMNVPCNSNMCRQQSQCSMTQNACAYQMVYLSNGTSSAGVLVEDVLHLVTDDSQQKVVDAPITLGCGIIQTGSFLDGAALNGLFGLGMDNISVPSILASQGLAANSFSMCFGPDGVGRIVFGDKGSSDQGETPFHLNQKRPTYNISATQIIVGDIVTNQTFAAIFDSGTSFTSLNDPAYTIITENFNVQAKEKRRPADSSVPFEYCYDLSANQTSLNVSSLTLTMESGNQFSVTDPVVLVSIQGGGSFYCLGVVKSGDINIIGQNFMTGYRIVFNRENMVLGWSPSDCYDDIKSNMLPINPRNFTGAPSPTSVDPEATGGQGNGSPFLSPVPPLPSGSNSSRLNPCTCTLLILLSIFSNYLTILS